MPERAPDLTAAIPETPGAGVPGWPAWTAGLALGAGIAVALACALLAAGIGTVFGAPFSAPPTALRMAATVAQDLGVIAIALACARLGGRSLATHFGLRATALGPALGAIAVAWATWAAFSALWLGLVGSANERRLAEDLGLGRGAALSVGAVLVVCVLAPAAEELLFRGYVFTALRNWRGVWPAALLSGVAFGAVHAGSADPRLLVPLAALGVALCLLYVRTGSLYPCVALHAANNAIALGSAHGWSWQTPLVLTAALAVLTAVAGGVRYASSSAPEPAPPRPSSR